MKFIWGAFCSILFLTSVRGATVAGYTAETNDRFANNGSFIASSYDLSGLGLSDGGKWVTMLSDNVFITSNHYSPATGESVTFYESNDPNGGSTSRTVAGTMRIGDSDLRIGFLSSPLTSEYGSFSFATENINNQINFLNSDYFGQNALIVGRSPGAYTTSQDMVFGRNVLDQWFVGASAGGTTDDAIGSDRDTILPPEYEAYFEGGDSGAPMFVVINGELRLVGINWFRGTQGTTEIIGMSYLGNYDMEIQDYINLHAVPEPSAGLLLLFSGSVMLLRRRR